MLSSSRAWAAPWLAAAVAACTPTYDWREIRADPPGLTALLPCKPDKGARTVPLGGTPVLLSMQGCERAGATFAVAWADMGTSAPAVPALVQWRETALAQMGASAAEVNSTAFVPVGATASNAAVQVRASGRAAGRPVQMRAAWFSRGSEVFQLMIVGEPVPDEAAEAFFSGVRLR